MDNYMVSPGNAWEPESFNGEYGNKSEAHRDEYFEKTDKGFYKLKDGYEQRSLGSNGNSLGAEMTYTTEWDDDDDRKQEHYGIFKKAEPKTVYKDNPTQPESKPTAEPKPAGPIKYSPTVQKAKERVEAYQNKDKSIYYEKNKFSDEYLNRTYDPMKL